MFGMASVWINEYVPPIPKNLYVVAKAAAEDIYQLFHGLHRLPCIVLRTDRLFAEEVRNKELDEQRINRLRRHLRQVRGCKTNTKDTEHPFQSVRRKGRQDL